MPWFCKKPHIQIFGPILCTSFLISIYKYISISLCSIGVNSKVPKRLPQPIFAPNNQHLRDEQLLCMHLTVGYFHFRLNSKKDTAAWIQQKFCCVDNSVLSDACMTGWYWSYFFCHNTLWKYDVPPTHTRCNFACLTSQNRGTAFIIPKVRPRISWPYLLKEQTKELKT